MLLEVNDLKKYFRTGRKTYPVSYTHLDVYKRQALTVQMRHGIL